MPVPIQVSLSADTLFITHHHPVLPEQILQHLTVGVAYLLHHLGCFCAEALIDLKHQGSPWREYSSRQLCDCTVEFQRIIVGNKEGFIKLQSF